MLSHQYIGSLIAAARVRKRLTQTDLGRLMSPPRTHAAVSDIERGKTKLDLVELQAMAVLLSPEMEETLRLLSPFAVPTCGHFFTRCETCGQRWQGAVL